MIQEEKLYSLKQTSFILGISKQTLRNWDNNSFFKAVRTSGKHRRYFGKQIKEKMKEMIECRKY